MVLAYALTTTCQCIETWGQSRTKWTFTTNSWTQTSSTPVRFRGRHSRQALPIDWDLPVQSRPKPLQWWRIPASTPGRALKIKSGSLQAQMVVIRQDPLRLRPITTDRAYLSTVTSPSMTIWSNGRRRRNPSSAKISQKWIRRKYWCRETNSG